MIQINTAFNPFRMKASRSEPVNLQVDLKNDGDEGTMLTLEVLLSKQLSFERTGYKTEARAKIDKLGPGERKRFDFVIFPKAGTRTEDQPVEIKVTDHYNDYNHVRKEYSKRLSLRVDK